MVHLPEADSSLTPDQRRHEIASLLARGVLRLQRAALAAPEAADPGAPEPTQKDLEVWAPPRPHVTRG